MQNKILINPKPSLLYEHSIKYKNYNISSTGALIAYSGEKTGRCPKNKRIVDNSPSKNIWWGPVNIKLKEYIYDSYKNYAIKTLYELNKSYTYIIDGYAGWDDKFKVKIRVVCCNPYHALFMRNMIIPSDTEFESPEFTIYNIGHINMSNVHYTIGTDKVDNSLTDGVVALNFQSMDMVIIGTEYAGEMKKGILTMMMYKMPIFNTLPLHSSANIDDKGNTTIFFGLSGTGKTTLSADPNRYLIGDDEHVWTNTGLFNIEGGCYAKCIGLDPKKEPDIFNAIKFGSVLENVIFDENHVVDYDNTTITKNTRCAYPLNHINNAIFPSIGNHPNNIILLTCDAFGILPPICKLTPKQAVFFFISGYTSKIPGTEVGVKEPIATFSTCFGEPFIVWQPEVYGKLLEDKLNTYKTNTWLINTGWIAGKYGEGRRIPLKETRNIINAIHDKSILDEEFIDFPFYNVKIPKKCKNVTTNLLDPRLVWKNTENYYNNLNNLVKKFQYNFISKYGEDLYKKLI